MNRKEELENLLLADSDNNDYFYTLLSQYAVLYDTSEDNVYDYFAFFQKILNKDIRLFLLISLMSLEYRDNEIIYVINKLDFSENVVAKTFVKKFNVSINEYYGEYHKSEEGYKSKIDKIDDFIHMYFYFCNNCIEGSYPIEYACIKLAKLYTLDNDIKNILNCRDLLYFIDYLIAQCIGDNISFKFVFKELLPVIFNDLIPRN